MGVRREGREAAVQFLYQSDLGGAAGREEYFRMRGISPSARRFCEELLGGVESRREEVDALIRSHTRNYEFSRISVVDRNILRVAISEMLTCPGIPPVVSINEAIEIAKKYSTEDSGKFVNGILDKIRGGLSRPAREAAE
jgi:transcription antitermination protein NusB